MVSAKLRLSKCGSSIESLLRESKVECFHPRIFRYRSLGANLMNLQCKNMSYFRIFIIQCTKYSLYNTRASSTFQLFKIPEGCSEFRLFIS